MRRWSVPLPHVSHAVIALVLIAGMISATEPRSTTPHQQDDAWNEQLTALNPNDPGDYFELAEEVADRATSDSERQLAQHLFRLAGALDEERYGRSAALALADLARIDTEKRTWLALATLLDRRSVMPAWSARQDERNQIEPDRALALCNAFSYYRLGRGERVLQLDREHDIASLLRRFSRQLGDPDRFLEDARLYQRGARHPRMTDATLVEMLRLEVALLSGPGSSWSSDRLLNGGDILVEVDTTRPAEAFGIDPTMAYYRSGRWTNRP